MGESIRLKRGTKSSCLNCGKPLTWTHQKINPDWDDYTKERHSRERSDRWFHDHSHEIYCVYGDDGQPIRQSGSAQAKTYCNWDLKGKYDTQCCKAISDALQIEGSPACGMHVKDWRVTESAKKLARQREEKNAEDAELALWKIQALEAKLNRIKELGLKFTYPDEWKIKDQRRHTSFSIGRFTNEVTVDMDELLDWALDIRPQTIEEEEGDDDDTFDS